MILINLLPHREIRRRQRRREFFVGVLGSVVVGVAVATLSFTALTQMSATQSSRNAFLKAEVGKLDTQIKDIATLRTEIEALRARQTAVENLQTDRNLPVFLLDELVAQTPEGVNLATLKQTGDDVSITGTAQSNERISEFLRNTANQSAWLQQPQLQEIRAVTVGGGPGREARRVAQFSVRLKLKRPGAPEPTAAPAAPGAPPRKSP